MTFTSLEHAARLTDAAKVERAKNITSDLIANGLTREQAIEQMHYCAKTFARCAELKLSAARELAGDQADGDSFAVLADEYTRDRYFELLRMSNDSAFVRDLIADGLLMVPIFEPSMAQWPAAWKVCAA